MQTKKIIHYYIRLLFYDALKKESNFKNPNAFFKPLYIKSINQMPSQN